MKSLPPVTGAIIASLFFAVSIAGTSAAQSAELAGAETGSAPVPTPARYVIGAQTGFEEATRQLAEQGFEVMEYELDGRRIEVTGLTATGHCMELKFNAASGKEVRRKPDDDCGPHRTVN